MSKNSDTPNSSRDEAATSNEQEQRPRLAQTEPEIIGLMENGLQQMLMMNMPPAQLMASAILHVGKCLVRAIYATAGQNEPQHLTSSRIVIAG